MTNLVTGWFEITKYHYKKATNVEIHDQNIFENNDM